MLKCRPIKLNLEEKIGRIVTFYNWCWDVEVDHSVENVRVSSNEAGTFFEVELPSQLYHVGTEGQNKEEHLELDGDYLVANFDEAAERTLAGELFVAKSASVDDLMESYMLRQKMSKKSVMQRIKNLVVGK